MSRERTRRQNDAAASVVSFPREPVDEALLVRGVISKEPTALAELFDRFAPLVRAMLVRVLGSTRDVDDLVQEVFLTVIRRAPTLRKLDALRSFVIGVSLRVAKNEIRRRKIRRFVGLEDVDVLPMVGPHDAVAAEGLRHAYAALDRLDAASRVLFVLRHVEGLELGEIAEASGCSLATVKRRLSRAEKRFLAIAKHDPALEAWVGRPQ